MAKFLIVVGTVNGHAFAAAQGAAALLKKLGHSTQINVETQPADLLRDADEIILACCSTTDQGKLPYNIYPLYRALEDQQLDLSNRHYGVIALGDSYFPPSQYALGGISLENAFYSCGAKRIGDIGLLDAQSVDNYPLAAALWVQNWLQKIPAINV
ncbi:MAG TPA: flavodoxin domain-containing protein [Cellvibrionaceae bacterium]|nr:flavodoxin domain-containing protein [Cellvibrionaceae bacterium]HMW73491.1 flavodoxin domain-containing protein [Cellvibrionaceae bacterium]HMY39772.1 flavodoxin domain-containing protein [Marinagarivorans sp.]HNG61422.1 flavodoxin domain-containing protein [Cellvibrionaceae bacterium]